MWQFAAFLHLTSNLTLYFRLFVREQFKHAKMQLHPKPNTGPYVCYRRRKQVLLGWANKLRVGNMKNLGTVKTDLLYRLSLDRWTELSDGSLNHCDKATTHTLSLNKFNINYGQGATICSFKAMQAFWNHECTSAVDCKLRANLIWLTPWCTGLP